MNDAASLASLYAELNALCFDGMLPPCRIEWSRRLTRAAGNIDVRRRFIKLSTPLLLESFAASQGATLTLFGPEYLVCGVPCDSPQSALREILKHEMIHLWLHHQGLPCGHTGEFRRKARAIGQPRTRHGIALPPPKNGWIYSCPACFGQYPRRRRYGRPTACGPCCKKWSGGKFDERFKLRGKKVVGSK